MRFWSEWTRELIFILTTQFHISQGSNVIEIEVISLEATENLTKTCTNDELLYVEYSLLGWNGHLLETQGIQAPHKSNEILFYRQTQRFQLDPLEHAEQIKKLISMLDMSCADSNIKFFVVQEGGHERRQECREVGWVLKYLHCAAVCIWQSLIKICNVTFDELSITFSVWFGRFAHVKINAIVNEATENSEIIKTEVFSTSYPHQLIAYLQIRLTGIDFMKQLITSSQRV